MYITKSPDLRTSMVLMSDIGHLSSLALSHMTHAAKPSRSEIVFLDASLVDGIALLGTMPVDAPVITIDSNSDGLAQISVALSALTSIDAIHIISHGESGILKIGNGNVNAGTLAASAHQIRGWAASLAQDSDILLYGCNIAAGADGRSFVEALAELTGSAIAAATHKVGNLALGGMAVLDYEVGRVTTSVIDTSKLENVLTGAAPPPAGFPIAISNFASITSGGEFVLQGSASIAKSAVNGNLSALQLTPNTYGQAGIATYNQEFSADLGITVNFTYASEFGSPGADGIVFYLLNADEVGSNVTSIEPGGTGGALGYTDKNGGSGLTDAFLGIGFDTIGNFSNGADSNGSGLKVSPNSVAIRGQGNGTTGYAYLTGAPYPSQIDGVRDVQINLQKISATSEQVTVLMAPQGGSFVQVLTTVVQQTLPNNFYLGFTAGTGSLADLHQITSLSVAIPVTLNIDAATIIDVTSSTINPQTVMTGDTVSFTYNVNNTGTNGDSTIVVANVPTNFAAQGWTVKDSSGTISGSGSNIPVNLLGGASATIVVTGTATMSGSIKNIGNTTSLSAGPAYRDTNVAGTSHPTNLPLVINAVTPTIAKSGQSEVIGGVTPDLVTDALSITKTSGVGTVSLGTVVNGVRQIIYTAPASSSFSTDFVGFTVTETGGADVKGSGFSAVPLAAAIPILTLALTNDSGSSQSDHITNDDRFHVGSDTAGTVTLTENDQTIGTGVVTAGGYVDITPIVALPQGAQNVTVTESKTGVKTLSLTLDTVAPVVTIASVSVLTNLALQTISGTATDQHVGSVVSIYDNAAATALAVTTVGAGGRWSTQVNLGKEGSHSLIAKDTDSAGNTGSSTSVVDTLDTTAPTLTVTEKISGLTNQTSDVISGTATDANGVSGVKVFDGSTDLGAATFSGNTWSFAISNLSDGVHTFSAVATDKAGNSSNTMLATAPVTDRGLTENVFHNIPNNGYPIPANITAMQDFLAKTTPTYTFTNTADTFNYSGGEGAGQLANVWFGSDAAGAALTDTFNMAGNIAFEATGYINATVAGDYSFGLRNSFKTDDAATVRVDGNIVAQDNYTRWGLSTPLNSIVNLGVGLHAFDLTYYQTGGGHGLSYLASGPGGAAVNYVQNGTVAAQTMTVDTIAPVVTITSAGKLTNTATQMITGTVTDLHAGSTVSIYDNSGKDAVGKATVAADGSWYTKVTLRGAGLHSLVAMDTDGAGNTGQSAAVVDTLDPPPIVGLAQNPTAGNAYVATLGTARPAIAGDLLVATVTSDAKFPNGGSTISIIGGDIVYTPGVVTAATAGPDMVSYTVTDMVSGAKTMETQTILLGVPAATTVILNGWNNIVGGLLPAAAASTVTGSDIVGPQYGNAKVLGTPVNETITAQGWSNTIYGAGGNDKIYAGQGQASVTVGDLNGNNVVSGSQGQTAIVLGSGDNSVSANGWNNVVRVGDGSNTISGSQGNETISVGKGVNVVALSGWNNVFTAGNGNNTVSGGQGSDNVTIGDGNNTLVLSGWSDVLKLGNGHNQISGTQGNATITVGNGVNVIATGGYGNIITAGNGDNTIIAGDGNDTVTFGSGSDVVTLSGWNNLVIGGPGQSTIHGGDGNTYRPTEIGTVGGMTINDFSTTNGDVLDLQAVLANTAYNGENLGSIVSVADAGKDALVSITSGGVSHVVADLHGLAGTSLASLLSSHSLAGLMAPPLTVS